MWKVVVLSLIFAGAALGGSRSQNPDDQDPEVMGFFPERPEIVMKAEPGLGDLLDWAKQKKENAKLPVSLKHLASTVLLKLNGAGPKFLGGFYLQTWIPS